MQTEVIYLQQERHHRARAQNARRLAETTQDADLAATLNEYAASLEELQELCRRLRRAAMRARTLAGQVNEESRNTDCKGAQRPDGAANKRKRADDL
jgi:hypothetical protein